MSEIRVYPGTIIDGTGSKVIFTLTPIIGETREEYEHRCQEVFKLAVSLVAPSSPTFEVGDTSRYRKVGEHAYEIVTPGYKPQEEEQDLADNLVRMERDTHFTAFARLVAQEIGHEVNTIGDFDATYGDEAMYLEAIREILARRAYDLVFHLLKHGDPIYLDMSGNMSEPPDADVHQSIAGLPDMDKLPK